MLSMLEYSTTHFYNHILKMHIEKMKKIKKGEFYATSITIKNNEIENVFYLFFSQSILQEIASILIPGEDLSENDWQDLTKECTNQIIGCMKKLLNDAQGKDEYKLGIPKYLGKTDPSSIKLNEFLVYKLDDHYFKIGFNNYE
ncbi:chemotaxis protein CheX [Campylobacter sp. 2018MI35]|uniref:chemotaxis protein CheX n=1 Tax=Campylobacter sp. 2018MI34 TaxID=2800582 RepID=UPI0019032958|nr:chemotaxis protein CheX [Campylobacter sp. 2018MI34]MBK1991728.1 chemotaxis protein CheX [Campylobacter sp. 2018MI34]